MKLLAVDIEPEGLFGTELKGDTLFGHFCWHIAYDSSLAKGGLEACLSTYAEKPFAIFSSAVLHVMRDGSRGYALRRPALPMCWLSKSVEEDLEQASLEGAATGSVQDVEARKKQRMLLKRRKELKRKRWFCVGEDLRIDLKALKLLNDEEIFGDEEEETKGALVCSCELSHNTIDRLTGTTGTGPFAPYSMPAFAYRQEIELTIFVLYDEDRLGPDAVVEALRRIGAFGYGRDASIGLGRFSVDSSREIEIPKFDDANACYSLAPCLPAKESCRKSFFEPFVRFGKHGDVDARSANPFKNPVILADEGAVFVPKDRDAFNTPYIGTALTGLSASRPDTVGQGYALYLPVQMGERA